MTPPKKLIGIESCITELRKLGLLRASSRFVNKAWGSSFCKSLAPCYCCSSLFKVGGVAILNTMLWCQCLSHKLAKSLLPDQCKVLLVPV